MGKSILEHMEKVKDFRNGNAIAHKLIDILTIVILGTLSAAENFVEIEEFANAKKEWLQGFLELPHGIPSHDTLSRVFRYIDPAEFQHAFYEWVEEISQVIHRETIAIDGKTLRRSQDKKHGTSAIHVVSAWADEQELVLGQYKVEEKSNEIKAIPELIKLLELTGCIVTIDAMGTQKEIARDLRKAGADYILSLKENQKTLYEDVSLYLGTEITKEKKEEYRKEGRYQETIERDHGRMEVREYYITDEISWLTQKQEWESLKSVGMVRSKRTMDGKTSENIRYYISSLEAEIEPFSTSIRKHWGVENKLHWVLDVSFREDENRTRKDHGAENLAIIRHILLNLLKQETTKKASMKVKRLLCSWDSEYLLKVLGIEVK